MRYIAEEPEPGGPEKPKGKRKGKKQPDLPAMKGPGVEQVAIPEIDDAAEEYVEWRDKRCAISPKEVEAKKKLIKLMKDHKLTTYMFDSKVVTVVPKEETVKVKEVDDDVNVE